VPLDATLRFDLADWRTIALELRGRACACRSVDCLDTLDVAIAQLETKPTPEVSDDDAAAVHALMVEAFADNAEVVLPFDRWQPWMTGDPGFDTGVWFLAEAGPELVGACLCWAEGWVKDVGVRPPWRGRGLGEALLREAFGEFHRRGLATVGLKVDSDNPTGAVRLYERVGMLPDRTYVMFSRPAPKGV